MDEKAKKHALRLVPYGLYLAGSKRADGTLQVSLASWFTQTSFTPPLVVVGLHREGAAYQAVQETGVLALSLLGSDQADMVQSFFKHVDCVDGRAGDHGYTVGRATGCPMVSGLPVSLELEMRGELEGGDHAPILFEVVEAHMYDKNAKALTHGQAGLHYAG